MSHLSILPTVLRDAEVLAATLESMGLPYRRGGELSGFGADRQNVDLLLVLEDDHQLGWARQEDGCLALLGDLQRISRSTGLQQLLSRITRAYAAHHALLAAAESMPMAVLRLHA